MPPRCLALARAGRPKARQRAHQAQATGVHPRRGCQGAGRRLQRSVPSGHPGRSHTGGHMWHHASVPMHLLFAVPMTPFFKRHAIWRHAYGQRTGVGLWPGARVGPRQEPPQHAHVWHAQPHAARAAAPGAAQPRWCACPVCAGCLAARTLSALTPGLTHPLLTMGCDAASVCRRRCVRLWHHQ
jgi:hypothetical protein